MKTIYVNAGDVKLHAKIHEPKESENPETIIFIHGYPDTHTTWSKQIDAFKENYRLVLYDLRGTGGSTPPHDRTGYHIDYLMNDLNCVIKELAGNEKVHIVGHDWGGIIAWSYLSIPSYAEKVKSFTAIGAPHPTLATKNIMDSLQTLDPFAWFQAIQQILKSWYVGFLQIPRLAEFFLFASPESIWNALISQSGIPPEDEMRHKNRQEILSSTVGPINMYRELVQGGLPPLPPEPIQIPVSVITADKDLALTNIVFENVERLATKVDIRKMDTNHWVHREKPDEFNRLLGIFLKRTKARSK
ncbi:MAG: alpha/beta fold hydrolase [Spirochaetota bacterium]